MNKIKNIFFFGISPLGYRLLLKIYKNKKYKIIGVIGKKNKKKHANLYESLLKKFCLKNNLNYFDSHTFQKKIKKTITKHTMGIIGGYDGIITKEIIKLFDLGIYNIHFGLIPYTRGCNPTMWCFLQGNLAGYTLYRINQKIDYGKIYQQKKILIRKNDNSFTIFKKLTNLADNNFNMFLNQILKNKIKEIKYPYKHYSNNYFNKVLPNNGFLNWNWSNKLLKNFNDAFNFPGYLPSKTTINSKEIYLTIIKLVKDKNYKKFPNGKILSRLNNKIKVVTNEGYAIAKIYRKYNFLNKKTIFNSIETSEFTKILTKLNKK